MTLIKPDGNDGAAREILRVAEELFEHAILEFNTKAKQLVSGETSAATALDAAKNLTSTSKLFLIEKQKFENSNRKDSGIVHDYAIDLEQARQEIRRRLARLRAVADPGEISE